MLMDSIIRWGEIKKHKNIETFNKKLACHIETNHKGMHKINTGLLSLGILYLSL